MKWITLSFLFAFLFACKSVDNVSENGSDAADATSLTGEIALQDNCGYVVKVKFEGSDEVWVPVALDDAFKKEGMKVRFSYVFSRAPLPQDCAANKMIVVTTMESAK